jgi:hypothetical protein
MLKKVQSVVTTLVFTTEWTSRTARQAPLQAGPMMVGHRERFFLQNVEKSELRWYRGTRRPHKDAGVFV